VANAIAARSLILLIPASILLLASCSRAALVDLPEPALGEHRVIVGSFSGSGMNPQ
jgi:hypothetical protein